MPRRRRRRRRVRRRRRRFQANMGLRSCVVRNNVLGCDPLGFASAFETVDVWESTESEADGIDVFEVEDEFED